MFFSKVWQKILTLASDIMSSKRKLTACLMLSLLFSVIYVYYIWQISMQTTVSNALRIAETVEKTLDKSAIKSLEAKEEDQLKPQYQYLKESLRSVVKLNEGIRFAYLYLEKNGKIYFMVDSEPETSNDYSPPGQEYTEATDTIFQPFYEKKAFVTPPTKDRWGTWVSALVPVKDHSGNIIAVFGIDYPAEKWEDQALMMLIRSILFSMFLVLLLFGILTALATLKKEKEKLQRVEVLYQTLFQESHLVKLLIDKKNMKIVDANEAACAFYGYNKEKIKTMSITEINLLKKEALVNLIEKERKLQNTCFYFKHRLASGEIKDVQSNVSTVCLDNKEYFYSVVTDVTEKLVLETNLERAYQNLNNSVNEFLFVLDLHGKILEVNNEVLKKLGYEKEELVNKSVLVLHPDDEKERIEKVLHLMLDKKENELFADIEKKKGERFPVEIKTSHGFWNEIPVLFAVVKDISLIKKSEDKFNKAFNNNMAMMAISTIKEGILLDVNKAFLKTLGFKKEEVIGQKSEKINLFLDVKVRQEIHERFLLEGRVYDQEVNILDHKGNILTVIYSVEPIEIEYEKCILTIAVDITKRKEMERELEDARKTAEKMSRVKGQFLTNMSHEIRTPLSAIIGFLQILKETDLNEEQADYLKEIAVSSELLLRLINDILDMSKLEAGKVLLENRRFDLWNLLEGCVATFLPLAKEKDISLQKQLDNFLPKMVFGDSLRLQQVLNNLLSNAIKFTKKGKVLLEVKLLQKTEEEIKVLFIVEDSGIGISKDKQETIFSPFIQSDGSMSRKYGGTGLGLAIVKDLAELMGGTIELESEAGLGSKFFLTLTMKWCKNEIIESLLIDKNKIWDYIKEKIAKFSEDTGIERQEAEVLFKEYVNSANLLMQKIKEKLAKDDLTNVKELVHQLKGASGNFQLMEVLDLCLEFEKLLVQGDLENCKRVFFEIGQIFKMQAE